MLGEPGERLPPGRHGIPRREVAQNQRERLIAAMAESASERGFANVTVADVIARARVSSATFYVHFDNRSACMAAAFSELFARLLAEIESACAEEPRPEGRAAAAFRRALHLLRADLPTAQLLTVEVLGLGLPGARLQQAAIERLAELLRRARRGAREESTGGLEWSAVAIVGTLLTGLIAAGEAERLESFEDTLPDLVRTLMGL